MSLPIYGRNEAAITAREAQVPLADFDDGCNLPASNAPGIGIGGRPNPKLSDWTLLDQHQTGRIPQETQHIGINGIEEGSDNTLLGYPVQVIVYETADINNEMHFTEATAAAVPGAIYDGLVNVSGENIEIGDRVWGMLSVA